MISLECIKTLLIVQTILTTSNAHYMNQWAIEVEGGSQSEANEIANETGCENQGMNSHIIASRKVNMNEYIHMKFPKLQLIGLFLLQAS